MLVCPRCQRANPGEAAYCHFDGVDSRHPLGGGAGRAENRLPHEFVFPSGRRCRTYDDLVQGCQEEWDTARSLLRQGVLGRFLANAGRVDLAKAAQESKEQPDLDLALDAFLNRLPAHIEQGPRLDLNPCRLILGTLHVGDVRQVRLTILNQGKGLLHGTLTMVEGNSWLRVGEGKGNGEYLIKTAREQQIALRVDTRGLAAPHKYAANLTVITNGGVVEVPVRLDLAVYPFPRPPFQGVGSPREMAEKMRSQPKPAVALLESGEVARWFAVNGWTYPVLGPTAKGVAAVQQFFEGMGLSKPPPVQLAEPEVYLSCLHGEVAQGQAVLRTGAKKWVYARAESDVPWLRIANPNVSGPQQAIIAFEADTQALEPNRIHEGRIAAVANAGQALSANVRVNVRRPTPPPAARLARPVVVGAMAGLVSRLLLAIPADLYARILSVKFNGGVLPDSFDSWLQSPLGNSDYLKHFVLATWWLGAVIGAIWLWRRSTVKSDAVWGLIAGAAGGLAASATFACLLSTADLLPRFVWQKIGAAGGWTRTGGSAWLWLILWVALAVSAWTILGAAIGFVLGCAGRAGSFFLVQLSDSLGLVFRLCGMRKMAGYFAGH